VQFLLHTLVLIINDFIHFHCSLIAQPANLRTFAQFSFLNLTTAGIIDYQPVAKGKIAQNLRTFQKVCNFLFKPVTNLRTFVQFSFLNLTTAGIIDYQPVLKGRIAQNLRTFQKVCKFPICFKSGQAS